MRVRLLSDSCTTGWTHWGHAELWLTPESLVRLPRRSLTLAAAGRGAAGGLWGGAAGAMTREMRRSRGVGEEIAISGADWDAYVAVHPARVQVDLADVVAARLRAGLTTSRLSLELVDARRLTFLWMRNASAIPALQAALGDQLR